MLGGGLVWMDISGRLGFTDKFLTTQGRFGMALSGMSNREESIVESMRVWFTSIARKLASYE